MATYRRRVFLINKPFQLRFSAYVCSWLMGLSFIYPLIIYNLFDYFIRYASMDPLGPPTQILKGTRQEVLILLTLLQVTFLAVSFLISIFMSHRIAGPLYKLSLAFDRVKSGNLKQDLSFRKKDLFQDIAKDYNEMLSSVRAVLERGHHHTASAIAQLEKMLEQSPKEGKAELEAALASLRDTQKDYSSLIF